MLAKINCFFVSIWLMYLVASCLGLQNNEQRRGEQSFVETSSSQELLPTK